MQNPKWSKDNLLELKKWLLSFEEGSEIKVPDFLSFISITEYQKNLKEKQGGLHNGHFTEEAAEESMRKLNFDPNKNIDRFFE